MFRNFNSRLFSLLISFVSAPRCAFHPSIHPSVDRERDVRKRNCLSLIHKPRTICRDSRGWLSFTGHNHDHLLYRKALWNLHQAQPNLTKHFRRLLIPYWLAGLILREGERGCNHQNHGTHLAHLDCCHPQFPPRQEFGWANPNGDEILFFYRFITEWGNFTVETTECWSQRRSKLRVFPR